MNVSVLGEGSHVACPVSTHDPISNHNVVTFLIVGITQLFPLFAVTGVAITTGTESYSNQNEIDWKFIHGILVCHVLTSLLSAVGIGPWSDVGGLHACIAEPVQYQSASLSR